MPRASFALHLFKSSSTRHDSCDVNPPNNDVMWNAMRMNSPFCCYFYCLSFQKVEFVRPLGNGWMRNRGSDKSNVITFIKQKKFSKFCQNSCKLFLRLNNSADLKSLHLYPIILDIYIVSPRSFHLLLFQLNRFIPCSISVL